MTFCALGRILARSGGQLFYRSSHTGYLKSYKSNPSSNVRCFHNSSPLVSSSHGSSEGSEGVKNEDKNNLQQDLSGDLIKSVLALEEIDLNLYRATKLWRPIGGRGAYGGQVVGQALAAAAMTKPDDFHVHSLHCYFVKTGNTDLPVLYHVDRIRDGHSFCTRTVKATQKAETIMTMGASYHRTEETVLDFQYKMPEAPPPEEVTNYEEFLERLLELENLSEERRGMITKMLAQEVPIEIKPLNPAALIRIGQQPADPRLLYWVRAKGFIGENANLHRCVAAYLSDMTLLLTALVPFPKFRIKMVASLDHAMWFHSPFRTDEWLLYECECPRSVNARSFTQGRFWRQDGVLAVTVAQEGVIRGQIPERNREKGRKRVTKI